MRSETQTDKFYDIHHNYYAEADLICGTVIITSAGVNLTKEKALEFAKQIIELSEETK